MTSLSGSNDTSPYRWYLCVQQQLNPTKWDCARVDEKTGLYPYCEFDYKNKSEQIHSKAIAISKWQPRILDPLILHSKLHPKIHVTP